MAAALLVKINDGETIYLPLCTQRVLIEHLVPIIRSLNFFWLSMLEAGIPIDSQNIGELIKELTTLRAELEMKKSELSIFLCQRVTHIIDCLENIGQKNFEGYLG